MSFKSIVNRWTTNEDRSQKLTLSLCDPCHYVTGELKKRTATHRKTSYCYVKVTSLCNVASKHTVPFSKI